MIYRRETPNTPSKRFRTLILNPVGSQTRHKPFYKNHQALVARHNGTKVCLRRKKTIYITKFNMFYGLVQKKPAIVSEISLARRYKTFVGLITYSNGAVNNIPLFNGAFLGNLLRTIPYFKNPKIHLFSQFVTGTYIPVAYLSVMTCFFNIRVSKKNPTWFCRAAGTFCTLIRFNIEKGYCTVKLPSNKYRILPETSYVMLGRNSNLLPKDIWTGKAGINILRGFRPTVRGVAKNPVDHPHGGRTKTNAPERTPWGKVAKYNK